MPKRKDKSKAKEELFDQAEERILELQIIADWADSQGFKKVRDLCRIAAVDLLEKTK